MTNILLAQKPHICTALANRYSHASNAAIEDCFMRALEMLLEAPEIPQHPQSWVRCTAELMLRNELRKVGRLASVDLFALHAADDTERDVTTSCDVELLFRILSPAYSEIIREHHIQGLTIEEIAKKQNRSVAAVYKTYERAKAKARTILIKMGYKGGGDRCS